MYCHMKILDFRLIQILDFSFFWQAKNNAVFNATSPDPRAMSQEIWKAIEEANCVFARD